MVTWVIYDISSDRVRTRISKLCQQAGLYRVQESVFLGDLDANRRDELHEEFASLFDPETDKIYMAPICKEDMGKFLILGEGFDVELIANEKNMLVF